MSHNSNTFAITTKSSPAGHTFAATSPSTNTCQGGSWSFRRQAAGAAGCPPMHLAPLAAMPPHRGAAAAHVVTTKQLCSWSLTLVVSSRRQAAQRSGLPPASASRSCPATAAASPRSTTAALAASRSVGAGSARMNRAPGAHLGGSPKCSCQLSLPQGDSGLTLQIHGADLISRNCSFMPARHTRLLRGNAHSGSPKSSNQLSLPQYTPA